MTDLASAMGGNGPWRERVPRRSDNVIMEPETEFGNPIMLSGDEAGDCKPDA
jgi:hypothetical protein